MGHRLVVEAGAERGRIYPLSGSRMELGRDPAAAIPLADGKVSRRHAALEREGNGWRLRDLKSRNGTMLDERKIREAAIEPGQRIRVGETTLRLESEEPSESPEPEPEGWGTPAITQTLGSRELAFLRERPAEAGAPEPPDRLQERLMVLLEFARSLGNVRTVSELLDRTVAQAREMLEADRVVPVLDRDGKLVPRRVAAEGLDRRMESLPISMSVATHVVKMKCAVLSTAAAEDERFAGAGSIEASRITSVVAAPLLSGNEPLGVLYADRLGRAAPFDRTALETILALGLILGERLEHLQWVEQMSQSVSVLERQVSEQWQIVGTSKPMQEVFRFLQRVAPTDATVLITGESGTGKEMVARAVHLASPRKRAPFEAINCGAIPENLVESELFGHMKGAFTGAVNDHPGRFELADKGTIFLDEVGELPPPTQAALLRVLEDRKVRRVGSTDDRAVDVRVIAATNRDIEKRVREGAFREDLFFRLNVLSIHLPPLRERLDDLDPLCETFLARFCREAGRAPIRLAADAMGALRAHPWPGNVRELKNTLERLVVLCDKETVSAADLPPFGSSGGTAPPTGVPAAWELDAIERWHIGRALDAADGNKVRAAQMLGIDRSTLYAKIRKYGL